MPRHSDEDQSAEPITRAAAADLVARIYALVRACPRGRVTTYGWIANVLGLPRGGARVVGWVLNDAPHDAALPAQRVINSKGELSGSWAFGQRGRMRALLEAEGIEFGEDGRVNLKRYGWDPGRDLSPQDRDVILAAADQTPGSVSDTLLRQLQDEPASPFRPPSPPR